MIANGHQVALEYTLTLDSGKVVTTNIGADPLTYVHGGEQIPPALERQLEGLHVGDQREIVLLPEEGYGPVDPNKFVHVELDSVPEGARNPGTYLEVGAPEGPTQLARVHEVLSDHVVLDFNHALAGERLTFKVHILRIEASNDRS